MSTRCIIAETSANTQFDDMGVSESAHILVFAADARLILVARNLSLVDKLQGYLMTSDGVYSFCMIR